MTYQYEWQQCATAEPTSRRQVSAAGEPSYVVTDVDRGNWLSVQVRAWNSRAGSPLVAVPRLGSARRPS
jgi:hypothetical protein